MVSRQEISPMPKSIRFQILFSRFLVQIEIWYNTKGIVVDAIVLYGHSFNFKSYLWMVRPISIINLKVVEPFD